MASAGTAALPQPFFLLSQRRRKNMLGKSGATPMLAVKDLDRARTFYQDKLGLEEVDDFGQGFMLKSGDTDITVYKSEFAGTNKATALTFGVDDIENEVRALKDKGIAFEHYELEGLKPKGDIFEGEKGFKTAWFKDPDGNILSLAQER